MVRVLSGYPHRIFASCGIQASVAPPVITINTRALGCVPARCLRSNSVIAPHLSMELNMEGGCTCRQVRYRLTGTPLIVHACHCRWCQRETGTAHALNALYEADRVVHTVGEPEIVMTPSASGKGQKIARCPTCHVAVWSNYAQAGPAIR